MKLLTAPTAVLSIEKEGMAALLLEAGTHRRFDVAILGGKGQSTEAALVIADKLNLPLFVLHDFDRWGMSIAANIRDSTWRHRYVNDFPVIDVGLRLHQIAGLESEPVYRKSSGRGWVLR
jgi:DNA topoisomerase VI subunit A